MSIESLHNHLYDTCTYFVQIMVKKRDICLVALIFEHLSYSLIQMKSQGGDKYALSISVKFDQSTRRFGRISFARLFKLTKHIALLFYLLSPYLLSFIRDSRNVRKNMRIIKILHALEHRLRYDEFRRRWDSNSVSQRSALGFRGP